LVPALEGRINQINDLVESKLEDMNLASDRAERTRQSRQIARNTVGTLIISPTRELATQIANESIKLTTHHKDMETRLLVGGGNRRNQLRDWMRGRLDVVVATPGRLRDLIGDAKDGEAIREHLASTNMVSFAF
jgi:ATP-dependent RNA helicase MSS116